jgi:hypothetical protein
MLENDGTVDVKLADKKRIPSKQILLPVIVLLLLLTSLSVYFFLSKSPINEVTGAATARVKTELEPAQPTELEDPRLAEQQERIQQLDPEQVTSSLLEEAGRQNIEITDEDADEFLKKGLEAYQLTEQDLQDQLDQAGVTYKEYIETLKEQLTVAELIKENVDLEKVSVSDGEVENFIQANSAAFQDILEDDDLDFFKEKVRNKLLMDKQNDLVLDYVETLQ